MHPRPEIFAILAVLTGLVAGWGNGANEAIGGVERTSEGAARLAITNTPMNSMCLRLTVTGSRTDIRTFPVGPASDAEVEVDALPAGRDTFLAETFSVPCADVTDGRGANGHSEPVVGLVSVGDTARVDLVMIRDVGTPALARLSR
ncbi:MAG TPA: hypothetical protein VF395_00615 [Polyangiaceae bacterium]